MYELSVSSGIVFVLSLLITYYLSRPGALGYFQDIPNHRSSHDRIVSRSGGIAIIAASVVGIALVPDGWAGIPVAVLLGMALLMIVSVFDDRGHVDWRVRALIHFVAAICLLWSQHVDIDGFVLSIGAIIAVVWFVNLYNFMDGSDGLAGLMALMGYSVIALLSFISGQADIFAVALVMICAVLGFLVFNFPPAKIFMGDTGAIFLGFSLAWLVLWSINESVLSLMAAVLLFSPFWVDATATLVGRIFRRERVWEAHKQHYYQRLITAKFSHRKVLLMECGLMLSCASAALIYQLCGGFGVKLATIGVWAVLMLVAISWVRHINEGIR